MVTLYKLDEEHLSVYLNGSYVVSVNHDSHGWEGMDVVEKTVRRMASLLDVAVEERYEEEPEEEEL